MNEGSCPRAVVARGHGRVERSHLQSRAAERLTGSPLDRADAGLVGGDAAIFPRPEVERRGAALSSDRVSISLTVSVNALERPADRIRRGSPRVGAVPGKCASRSTAPLASRPPSALEVQSHIRARRTSGAPQRTRRSTAGKASSAFLISGRSSTSTCRMISSTTSSATIPRSTITGTHR